MIDTPEFQRLHRIRQLSTAYFAFPSAEHTRFSHSIGTYFVMQLLIDHFRPIFSDLNIDIPERNLNLALGVSLLHDIGHGPFSHAFENALPNDSNRKLHEQWTTEIIRSDESSLHKVLVDVFVFGKWKSVRSGT